MELIFSPSPNYIKNYPLILIQSINLNLFTKLVCISFIKLLNSAGFVIL